MHQMQQHEDATERHHNSGHLAGNADLIGDHVDLGGTGEVIPAVPRQHQCKQANHRQAEPGSHLHHHSGQAANQQGHGDVLAIAQRNRHGKKADPGQKQPRQRVSPAKRAAGDQLVEKRSERDAQHRQNTAHTHHDGHLIDEVAHAAQRS